MPSLESIAIESRWLKAARAGLITKLTSAELVGADDDVFFTKETCCVLYESAILMSLVKIGREVEIGLDEAVETA